MMRTLRRILAKRMWTTTCRPQRTWADMSGIGTERLTVSCVFAYWLSGAVAVPISGSGSIWDSLSLYTLLRESTSCTGKNEFWFSLVDHWDSCSCRLKRVCSWTRNLGVWVEPAYSYSFCGWSRSHRRSRQRLIPGSRRSSLVTRKSSYTGA